MFENLPFDENGEKVLCSRKGKNADMNMDITVKRLEKGRSMKIFSSGDETAVLLIKGKIIFKWNGEERECSRRDAFEMKPYCLHADGNTPIEIEAAEASEFVIQQTDNDKKFDAVFYTPENCLYQEFGLGQWNGTGHRVVSTMFDIDNAPYSNMVMGEVFNKPGRWSSYPPHHHPQPEVYYYQFDKPQGFGACFNGDEVYKSVDGSFCTIRNGQDHEQAVAPGYNMYYVWMIRHIDGDPWYKTTRIVSDEHKWLLDEK